MCGPGAHCGIYAFEKDGIFTRVAGMKESPVNEGSLCVKGLASPQWVYSPDRLKYPMKRIGEKGEGKCVGEGQGRQQKNNHPENRNASSTLETNINHQGHTE
jgi:hypothetical protein